jgi:hypothetical protein
LPKNNDATLFEYELMVLCSVNVSAILPYAFETFVPLNFTSSVPVTVKLDPLNVKLEFPNTPVPPVATVKTLAKPVEPTIETELPPAAAGPVGPVIPVGPVTVLVAPVGPVFPVGPVLPIVGMVVLTYEMVEPLNPSVRELDACVVA